MENHYAFTNQQQENDYTRRARLEKYARRNFLERANAYDEKIHGAYRVYMEQCEEQYQLERQPESSRKGIRR
jgi:hypothetical protein